MRGCDMKLRICWRGWHTCPLLIIGRYTFWFTNGITFGHKHNCGHITYYCGWLIVGKETKYHEDFVKQINAGTWPKHKLWIVKYGK